jgi:predicted transcriptional regulator
MKTYIAKQPKITKERIETKLEQGLARTLEKYCEYLDSDRDYVISQALAIAFKKDAAFAAWLAATGPGGPATSPAEKHK